MSHTNTTLYNNLPQFTENDKPAWLADINPAMQTIDRALQTIKETAETTRDKVSDYDVVKDMANGANTKANKAQETAETANTLAEQAKASADTANSSASSAQQSADNALSAAQSAGATASQALQSANKANNAIATAMIFGQAKLNTAILGSGGSTSAIYCSFDKNTRMLYINGGMRVQGMTGQRVKFFTLPLNIVEEIGQSTVRNIAGGAVVVRNDNTVATSNGVVTTAGDFNMDGVSNGVYFLFNLALYTGEW